MTPNTRSSRSFIGAVAFTSIISLLCGPLLACTPQAQFDDVAAATHERDDDDDGLRDIELAEQISADPLFHSLLQNLVVMTAQRAQVQHTMSDEDLQAFVVTVGNPNYTDIIELDEFLEATGVQQVLLQQQLQLTQQLIAKYDLVNWESADLEAVFAAAASTDDSRSYLEGAIENELRDITDPLDTEIDDCEAACVLQYTVAAASALVTYAALLAGAAASGPFAPIALLAASASYFVSLALAQAANDDCFAVCNGEQPSGQACDKDADCKNNEFCWKGVIGIGENECRPEKPEGDTCARHGQCTSGCCKLHFWTNPISKTCRPANAC